MTIKDSNRIQADFGRIRWVAFDAVGTLIDPDPPVSAIYQQIGARYGSRRSRDEVSLRFRETFARLESDGSLSCECAQTAEPFHTCERREWLRWRSIVEDVLGDAAHNEACFQELFEHFGQPSSWKCFPDVERTLSALSAAGLRLAVSSNFDGRLNAVMDGLPALNPIELRVISSQVGHRKPSGRFFQSLLKAASCLPSELLFVGDSWENDVRAANAVGIPALQIDRSAGDRHNRSLRSLSELHHLLGSPRVRTSRPVEELP